MKKIILLVFAIIATTFILPAQTTKKVETEPPVVWGMGTLVMYDNVYSFDSPKEKTNIATFVCSYEGMVNNEGTNGLGNKYDIRESLIKNVNLGHMTNLGLKVDEGSNNFYKTDDFDTTFMILTIGDKVYFGIFDTITYGFEAFEFSKSIIGRSYGYHWLVNAMNTYYFANKKGIKDIRLFDYPDLYTKEKNTRIIVFTHVDSESSVCSMSRIETMIIHKARDGQDDTLAKFILNNTYVIDNCSPIETQKIIMPKDRHQYNVDNVCTQKKLNGVYYGMDYKDYKTNTVTFVKDGKVTFGTK